MADQQTNYKKIGLAIILLAIFLLLTAFLTSQGMGRGNKTFWSYFALPRVWMGFLFGAIGLVLLLKSRVSKKVRLGMMALAFFTFGLVPHLNVGTFSRGLSMHPSPMCLIEKSFIFMNNGISLPMIFITLLASIVVLTVVGNKLFCGWVCPVGALQELINDIPLTKRMKKIIPFKVSNTVRISMFGIFILLFIITGFSIYGLFNPFEFFHFHWAVLGIIAISVTGIASLFLFRPFCYLACPLGLFTWIFEQASVFRVKREGTACKDCNRCVVMSHCPSVKSILEKKRVRADCFSCGRCLNFCTKESLYYKS